MNNAVVAENLSHVFKEEDGKKIEVLRDVSFSVKPGEFFTILGPSGCGKSTLLRIVAGMIPPTKGIIQFHDNAKSDLSMIFQASAIFPWLTVYQNVEFGLKMRNMPESERQNTVKEHIREIGLSGFEHSYPKDLSGGMKQRVGIARALALNPKILLMDEAFSALDAFTAEKLRQEVLNLWLKDRMTIVMVTHYVDEAVAMSDRVLVMTPRPGRVEKVFPVDLPRPRNKRSSEFFALVDQISEVVRI